MVEDYFSQLVFRNWRLSLNHVKISIGVAVIGITLQKYLVVQKICLQVLISNKNGRRGLKPHVSVKLQLIITSLDSQNQITM